MVSQTDGRDVPPSIIPDWDSTIALATLGISEEPFSTMDGNCQGYAHDRVIAVSPIAALPHKTRFHELAHVLLGHTSGLGTDATPPCLREVEAEAVAMVCLEALRIPGAELCRGYIQHWNAGRHGESIPKRSTRRIFTSANLILRAGVPATGGTRAAA